jgi:[NiFe] hydrogenase diaphorase moiety large subunit
MLKTATERVERELRTLADTHGRDRAALIPILQDVQLKYGWVSEHAMQVIADQLGLHPVEVHSVLSFYSFLDSEPKGRFVIRLCCTVSCDMAGKARVAQQLERDLGLAFGETTPDGKFTLAWAHCIGMCDQGPALLVNDKVYTRVEPDMVHEILEECRQVFGVHAMAEQEGHSDG